MAIDKDKLPEGFMAVEEAVDYNPSMVLSIAGEPIVAVRDIGEWPDFITASGKIYYTVKPDADGEFVVFSTRSKYESVATIEDWAAE